MTVDVPAGGALGGEASLIGWPIDTTCVQGGQLRNSDAMSGSAIENGAG
jgi:hypothetical protein